MIRQFFRGLFDKHGARGGRRARLEKIPEAPRHQVDMEKVADVVVAKYTGHLTGKQRAKRKKLRKISEASRRANRP